MKDKNEYNLTPYTNDLTEIVIELILDKYDNVDLIAIYGSRARGDYIETSDLEFFVIAEEKFEDKLGFLFHGITVDVGSNTWKSKEAYANREGYWVVPAGTLAMAKVVYTRSEEVRERYETLRKKVIEQHQDDGLFHPFAAEETYQNMIKTLGHLNLSKLHDDLNDAHALVWGLVIGYTIVMANLNGKHLINNWGKSLDEVFNFPKQPEGTQEIITQMIEETDIDRIISLGTDLVNKVREYLLQYDEPEDDAELEMLNSVNALEYLYKMNKAIIQDHTPALAYAIQDSQPLFAKDLLKLNGNWTKFSKLLLYSEYAEEYHKQGFPNLLRLMLEGSTQELLDGISKTRVKVKNIVMDEIDLPNFRNLEDIKPYFESRDL